MPANCWHNSHATLLGWQVIKLDIDNSKLELALIYQIENDPQLPVLISDIMFEMHYDHPGG